MLRALPDEERQEQEDAAPATLSGSAAYAFAETFGWRQGLDEKLRGARAFYGVVILSTAAGIALDFLDVNPVRALYWTAVINGLLAPFLLVGILILALNRKLMRGAAEISSGPRGRRPHHAGDVRRRRRHVPPLTHAP